MDNKNGKKSICLVSSVPVTLCIFYRDLIRQLKYCDFDITLISSDMPELHNLGQELDCKVLPLKITRLMSPLKDLAAIYKLTRHLHREKYDIVHAHIPKGGLVGMISAFLAGVSNRVYTMHGLLLETYTGLSRKLLWLVEWLTCKLATELLAVSPSLRQRVLDEGLCAAEKINVLGNGSACGIDLNRFRPSESLAVAGGQVRAKYNIPDDAIVVGFVGRVVPDKGIKTLVQAFKKLQQVVSESYLLLVGEFETVRKTQALDAETMDTIKNNQHIIYNNQFTNDVLPFYAAMDIVTLPSRREGFGVTLIEAAALELPTIATKVTGCVDAVSDNITGLLVEVDNCEKLYEAMLKLVHEPDLRKKLGEQGCQRVKVLFNSKLLIDKHISFCERLIDKDTKY